MKTSVLGIMGLMLLLTAPAMAGKSQDGRWGVLIDAVPLPAKSLGLKIDYNALIPLSSNEIVADDGTVLMKDDFDDDLDQVTSYRRSFSQIRADYGLRDNLKLTLGARYLQYKLKGQGNTPHRKDCHYYETGLLRLVYNIDVGQHNSFSLAGQWRPSFHRTPSTYLIHTLGDDKAGKGITATYLFASKFDSSSNISYLSLALGYVRPAADQVSAEYTYDLAVGWGTLLGLFEVGYRGKMGTKKVDYVFNDVNQEKSRKVSLHEIYERAVFTGKHWFWGLEASYALSAGAEFSALGVGAQLGHYFGPLKFDQRPEVKADDYYATGKVVAVEGKADQAVVQIDRGEKAGVLMGTNVDVFQDKDGKQIVASGIVERVDEQRAFVKILQIFKKEVPLKKGMVIKAR